MGSLETAKTNKEKQLLQTYFLLMKGDDNGAFEGFSSYRIDTV